MLLGNAQGSELLPGFIPALSQFRVLKHTTKAKKPSGRQKQN
jgi:hypothetical protein